MWSWKKVVCWDTFLFFHVYDSYRVLWLMCLSSLIHQLILLLHLEFCCLLNMIEKPCEWKNCCVLSFVWTAYAEFNYCFVDFQSLTQWCCSCVTNSIRWLLMVNDKRMSGLLMPFGVLFIVCSPSISTIVSVVFIFNASLSDVAPVSPILFAVDFDDNEKECIVDEMNAICVVCSFLSLQVRSSWVSVVFFFNASLNDVAPVSPALTPLWFDENGK